MEGSAQAWAHWCSCPADFIHSSWLPEALVALKSRVTTVNAQQVMHQLLAAQLKLKAVSPADIENAPGAGLCLLPAPQFDRLMQPAAAPVLSAWHASVWPGDVLGGDAGQREVLRRERASLLLLQLAVSAWPTALVQRWRLRFDASWVERAEQHRLPFESRLAARRLRSLLQIAHRLEAATGPTADFQPRAGLEDKASAGALP